MNPEKKLTVFCLLILALSISACSGLTRSDKPATKTWWLEPYTGITRGLAAEAILLPTVTVTAVPGLDTDRILTLSETAELNHYSAARWADNLPELVSSLVGRSLELSGRFEQASGGEGTASGKCELQLELREFFGILSSSGQTTEVRIAIHGRSQCGSSEAESIRLVATAPVHENRMSVIVAAFQQAMDSTMKQVLEKL